MTGTPQEGSLVKQMRAMRMKMKRAVSTRRRSGKAGGDDALVQAYLENQGLEQAEAYISRGRTLAKVETELLVDKWVAAFKNMANARDAGQKEDEANRITRADLEAELLLRRVDLPYRMVERELALLRAALETAMDELRKDPARLAEVNKDIAADIAAFHNKTKARPSN
jgi:hypothetical protein